MRFVLSEYITLLKEDGELDTLIVDLLIGMKIIPISIPQKGRQHGVDIAAVGKDPEDHKTKVFLFVVKQGNLNRTNWDGKVNSTRPSLNEIKDVYINSLLEKKYNKLPVKIVVATNGEIVQNVQINWKQYIDSNSNKKRTYDFWGTTRIASMLDTYLDNEKLFPAEYQSLLRKTLAFLDVPDYNLSHFYELLDQILRKDAKQKQKILKKLRLVRLCLNILFKWSQDLKNLKPAVLASERCILLCWDWIFKNGHLEKAYVKQEFYMFYGLKRRIGITFFNKVVQHYQTKHSIYRYSKNYLEYSLNSWEHLGILATIGLAEIQEFRFKYWATKEEESQKFYKSAESVSNALSSFVHSNPPLSYPEYDEHCIEIALALQLLYFTGKKDDACNWIRSMVVAFHNNFVIYKRFPLFRTNFDKLVDIHNGDIDSEIDSSTILIILLEYSVLFEDEELYKEIRSLINDNFPKVNLQIWFCTEDVERFFCAKNYSQGEGTLKHSINIYDEIKEYKKEITEEVDLFIKEDKFEFYTSGFHLIPHISSRHFRGQPFPVFWRLPIKRNFERNDDKE
ncbi:hypothetical protein [Flagellimonas aequoris]|uniref:Uncharacterized protein n=1 Tax=Flagellimonas aequoris TaxID=2306997 RepID=A0A418N516_9FLAO|nr:hypothetical protein [Allomuricauda aequoris]RIV68942.1 hypothetical protein D2U88_17425 [Allomuricauda aequoris]TXK00651.1 hypothetical protein FQ019_17220 [Allomuricauda aequoris]